MQTTQKFCLRFLIATITTFCSTVLAAQEVGPPRPVDQSAYHVPVFRNEYATVLRVNIPAKRDSDYHTHSLDVICVVVEDYPPEAYSQALNGPPGAPRGAARGEFSFLSYSNKPLTHRAFNPGTLPRHSVCAELHSQKPHGFTPAAREVPGYKQELDNPLIRAWRVMLAPGQTANAITQNAPGLRIVINGGEIMELIPGKHERGMMLRQGDFYWQDAGVTRAVRNVGTTAIELIEIEFK